MTRNPPTMSKDGGIRQRAVVQDEDNPARAAPSEKVNPTSSTETTGGIGFVDVLRIIVGLALVSTVGSYLITSGESLTWGIRRPWFTKLSGLQQSMKGPMVLTIAELAEYSGADPSKPTYIALNRTIYDVSSSPHMYGPKGAYASLAGKDASRAFVTNCIGGDVDYLVPYFSDVEEIFVPLWLSKAPAQSEYDEIASGENVMSGAGVKGMVEQVQKKIGPVEVAKRREEAYAKAHDAVRAKVANWESMFERKEYPVVGKVVDVDESSGGRWRDIGFCAEALKQRPSMLESLTEAMQAIGKAQGLDIGKMAAAQKGNAGSQHGGSPKHAPGAGPASPGDYPHGVGANAHGGGASPHGAGANHPGAGANPHAGQPAPDASKAKRAGSPSEAKAKQDPAKVKKPAKDGNKAKSAPKSKAGKAKQQGYDKEDVRRRAEEEMARRMPGEL